ncbi:MAG: hypothetical protein JW849_07225 [Phycisphaerae bacterium]|nr:hypothetical protein [Phycisphaerae bacterium]
MREFWNWLIFTNAGLAVRIAGGVAIFALLAVWDIRRKGRHARRWREYVFLAVVVLIAMAYGVVNDLVSSSISWEYFYYGKNLEGVLGPDTPPNPVALHWEAMKIGAMATWTVGLLLGVAVLLANNPHKTLPQLPYQSLYRLVAIPVLTAALFGVLGGVLGYGGYLARFSDDLGLLTAHGLWRPERFCCTWGIHLGGYIGGPIGGFLAVLLLLRKRIRLAGATRGARERESKTP